MSEQVRIWGPETPVRLDEAEALSYCRQLANGHYENFSVVSSLVPAGLRDDFAVVYSFCRWADDLGDEIGDAAESRRLLEWWRLELERCFAGDPIHPVMVALRRTVERHQLPITPFNNLIDAFVQDQHVSRYDTWSALLDYCVLSANPVGRLVLMLLGERRDEDLFASSDAICTALQLTNHWQDVRRDLLERDRIYIPGDLMRASRFEERMRASAEQGWAIDDTFLEESRRVVRTCVNRTWSLYDEGESLLEGISVESRPVVALFRSGGMHVLRLIELWNCETVLHRPRLTKVRKLSLLTRSWVGSRLASMRRGKLE